jgi:hypothetical protein|tara:strand:+ start:2217 stop:2504 length:288 start_codon:yes stop_codon:yes gene_type:complete
MTNFVHRQGDKRSCGASTITKTSKVRVNGKFISVEGDTNTHGGGGLKPSVTQGRVRAEGKSVIILNDNASADNHSLPKHPNPKASSASPNVRAGG